MPQIAIQYFSTSLGELVLGSFQDRICLCDWRYRKMRDAVDNRLLNTLQASFVEEEIPLIAQTKVELNEYLRGDRQIFTVPLLLVGTDFQQTVWQELLKITFGNTETYLGLSNRLQNPKAIRAVATANGANALSILVPCHRIIGSKGELIGYAGGLPAKQKLLELEGSRQVSLF